MNDQILNISDVIRRAQAESERLAADPSHVAYEQRLAAEREAELVAGKARLWRDIVAGCVPVRVARLAWSPEETDAVKFANKWVDSGCEKDLVLRGGVGCGKSTAAVVAVKRLVEPQVRWMDGQVLPVGSIRPMVTWLRPDALVSAVMHSYDDKAPRLYRYVVIDDLGRETKPDFVEAFCDLLDRDGHTLIVTTNLTKEEMRKRYDLRILDRLNERAMAFDVPGESKRAKEGNF